MLEKTDALLILLNGEQYRLQPHACPQDQIAVSWGPSKKGVADLEMLSTALHECFHLCSTGGSPYNIYDSYKEQVTEDYLNSALVAAIESFNHSGFLPADVPQEKWPDTPVTRAIKAFDVPLFPHTEGDKRYWAVSDRYNVMDRSSQVANNPLHWAAFLGTGGRLVAPYQQWLMCQGTIAELLAWRCITPDEAAERREQFSPEYVKANPVSAWYYLQQCVRNR